ncbi:Methionyl-tRNA formyltransferase [Coemansia sp. RSA 2618]|nr:Methionyl-tRNA formyltransferase [Coemansia sp. RSA 2618]
MPLAILTHWSPHRSVRLGATLLNTHPWRRHRLSTKSSTQPQMRPGLKVLFFGTDEFASCALAALSKGMFSRTPAIAHIELVCPPPRFKQRGKKLALVFKAKSAGQATKLGIRINNTPEEGGLQDWQVPAVDPDAGFGDGVRFDIGVVASFGMFLPRRIIDSFPLGMVNVHPSLLPQYRGPSPVQQAIVNSDAVTGVTVQEVHPTRYDAGDVLAQVPYRLEPGMHRVDLLAQLGAVGGELAARVLENLGYLRERALKQDDAQATATRLHTNLDTRIDWARMSAMDIMRMHWAHWGHIDVWSYVRVKNKTLAVKITELALPTARQAPLKPDYLDYPPGTMFTARKTRYVELSCIDGGRLHATGFTVADKQPRDGLQFAAGYIKKSKEMRLLSMPPDARRPTPAFVYPEGHVRPDPEVARHISDEPEFLARKNVVHPQEDTMGHLCVDDLEIDYEDEHSVS